MAGKIRYPATVAYPPEMKIIELRVDTSLGTDELAPDTGKKIRVLGFLASQLVNGDTASVTTERATLAFGDDHVTYPSKILIGYRQSDPYDDAGVCMCNINVVGEVNEVVRLTNVTYTGTQVISRVTVYYVEE